MGTMADRVNSHRPATRPRTRTQWLFRPYWRRVRLRVGDRVSVASSPCASRYEGGLLRYWGKIHCAAGYWAGIELDLPHGQNNGSLDGRRYFLCSSDRGLFVRVGRCRTHDGYGLTNGRRTPSSPRAVRTGVSSGRRIPFPAQIARKRVDDEDSNSNVEPPRQNTHDVADTDAHGKADANGQDSVSVEPPKRKSLDAAAGDAHGGKVSLKFSSKAGKRVGDEDSSSSSSSSSSSVEPPRQETQDAADADVHEKTGIDGEQSSVDPPQRKTLDAADDAHGKVSLDLSSKTDLSSKADDKVALNLLSEADLSSKVALNLSSKAELSPKADGLSTGRWSPPPAVSSPDSSQPCQPEAVATTSVISTSTGSSSEIAGLRDISGLVPGSGLDPNGSEKNNSEQVQGSYEYALAQIPIDGEGGKRGSVAGDNTNTAVVVSGLEPKEDHNDCFITVEDRKGDYNSCVTTGEDSSQTRCRSSIAQRDCLARSCDEQGEAYIPGDASIYVPGGTSMYVPGGISMPGTIYSPALDTQATAHENTEGNPSVVGTHFIGWTADKQTNENPSVVGTPFLGWNLVERAVGGGGEKANANFSDSDHRGDHTSASSQLGRTTQTPLFQAPTLANLEVGGDMQELLHDDLRAGGAMHGLLTHDAPAAGSLSETLLPSENEPYPIPAPPVKGSSAFTVVVPARTISAAGEASPESCEGGGESCRREESFSRTSCDARHAPAVGTHRPSCLAGSTAPYAPEENVELRRLPADGVGGGTAKFETKEWQHSDAMEGSAVPNMSSNAMASSAPFLPSMSLDEVEDGAPSMPSVSNESGSSSDARTRAERCRDIVPWIPPFAAEGGGKLNAALYGVLPTPLRSSKEACQPIVWSAIGGPSALASTKPGLESNFEEFEANNLQVAIRAPRQCKNSQDISIAARTSPGTSYPAGDPALLPPTHPHNNQNIIAQREGGEVSPKVEGTAVLAGASSTTTPGALRLEMTRSLKTIARRLDGGSLVRSSVVHSGAEPLRAPPAPCSMGTTDRTTLTHEFPACQLALTTGARACSDRGGGAPLTAVDSGGATLCPDRTLTGASEVATNGNVEGEGFVHPLLASSDGGGWYHAEESETAAVSEVYPDETGTIGSPNQMRQLESSRYAIERALDETRYQAGEEELVDSQKHLENVEKHGRGAAATTSTAKRELWPQNLTSPVWEADVVHRSRSETSSDRLSEPFGEKSAETRRQKSGDETLPTGDHWQHESETMVSFAGGEAGRFSSQSTPRVSGKRVHVSVSQGQTPCSYPSSIVVKPSATTDKEEGGLSITNKERGTSTADKECSISTSRLICVSPSPLLGSLQPVGAGEPVGVDTVDDVDLAQVTHAAASVEYTRTLSATEWRADPPPPPTQSSLSPTLPRLTSTQSALSQPLPPPPPPTFGQLEQHAAPAADTRASVGSRSSSSGSMPTSSGNVSRSSGSVDFGTDFVEDDDQACPPRSSSYRRRRPHQEMRQQSSTGGRRDSERESIEQEFTQQPNRNPITPPTPSVQSGHTLPVGLVPAVSPGRMAHVPKNNYHSSQAGFQQQQQQQQQQEEEEAELAMDCANQSANRFQTRGCSEKEKCTEKKKRRFCRKRYPPPPGPPPSPSPDSRCVPPPRLRWELPVGKRAVARRESVGSCDVSQEHIASHDFADATPDDGAACSQESGQFCPIIGEPRAVVSETEQVEVVFLPPSTPPPPHAWRRAKRALLPTSPSPAPAPAVTKTPPDTPTSTKCGACSITKDTSTLTQRGECGSTRESSTSSEGELIAARATSSQRSTHRVCGSMNGVDDSGSESEFVAVRKNAVAGPHAREDSSHVIREGSGNSAILGRTAAVAAPHARKDGSYVINEGSRNLLGPGRGDLECDSSHILHEGRGDLPVLGCGDLECGGQNEAGKIEPVTGGGGWSDSCDGSAAKRRAHDICARVAALEGSLDRVEEEALVGTFGMGTASSGVDCVGDGVEHDSAGVERVLESAREGEAGMHHVTDAAARPEGAVSIRDVTDAAARLLTEGGGTITTNPSNEVAAVGRGDSTDDIFRAVLAIRDELSSPRLWSEGTTRDHQQTPKAARKPSAATETEPRSEQQKGFHGDTAIFPMALTAASQLAARGGRALEGAALLRGNSECDVDVSFLRGDSQNAVDTVTLVHDGSENAMDRTLGRDDSESAVDRMLRRDDSGSAVDRILRRDDSEHAVDRTLVSDETNNGENAVDSFYFNLGRSMVQDSFGSEQTVDTTSAVTRHSSGWDDVGLLGNAIGR